MISRDNIIFLGILVSICIILVVLYKVYRGIVKKQNEEPIIIRKPINGKKASIYNGKNIQVSKYGLGYTYSFWINVNDWSYRRDSWKHVLHKGDENGYNTQPGVWLTPKTNNMVIRYLTINNKGTLEQIKNKMNESLTNNLSVKNFYKPTKAGLTLKDIKELALKNNNEFTVAVKKGKPLNNDTVVSFGIIQVKDINDDKLIDVEKNMGEYFDVYTFKYRNKINLNPEYNTSIENDEGMSTHINNIPLNRWTHIAIVTNEQSAEVYVDGLLHSSTVLSNLIKENAGHLYINQRGGFGGMLTQLQYYNRPLNHNEIRNIEMWGPEPYMLPDLSIGSKFKLDNICPSQEVIEEEEDLYAELDNVTNFNNSSEDNIPAKFSYPN